MGRREQLEKTDELIGQAKNLVQQLRFKEAIEKLEVAKSIFKNLGVIRGVADMDALVGFFMSSQGTHQEALDRFLDAKTIYERLEMPDPVSNWKLKIRVADLEGKIGNEFQVLGQPKKALGHYKTAKASFERLNLPHRIAPTLVNIGLTLHDLGQLTEAITHYENAKNIHVELTMYHDLAITESRLGVGLADMGKLKEALKHYKAAKQIFDREMFKMKREAAGTEMNTGITFVGLGQFTEAITHYENAKKYFEMINEQEGIAKVENNIGLGLVALGKPEEALEYFDASKNIYKNSLKMPHHAASTDVNMAKALVLLHKPKEALKKCNDALSVFQDMGLIMEKGKVYRSMGIAKILLGDLEGALNDLERSIQLMEQVRMGVRSLDFQRSFKEEYLDVFDALWNVNLMLLEKERSSGRLDEALNYVELAKCSTVAEPLEAGGGGVPCPEMEELITHENQLLEKAKLNYRKMEDLVKLRIDGKITPPEFKGSITEWEREYNALHEEVERLRSAILVKCADFGNTPIPRTYNVLKRTLEVFPKDMRWCILEFAISSVSDRLFVFLVDQDSTIEYAIHDVDLGEIKKLTLRCQEVFDKVRKLEWEKANNELVDLSKKLYNALIPVEIGESLKSRDVEHLIVVPHKILHWVPFEALFDGDNYWGLKYAISTDFSMDLARLCVEKREKRDTKMKENPSFLLVKNPLLDREGMDKEVNSIINLLDAQGIQYNVLHHQNATKKALIEAANKDPFSVLFHAGHASFMGKNPAFSSLYLHTDGECPACSGKTKHHTYELLSASEIIHRVKFEGTPIVYLSACESGIAEVEPGDEMFGLVRALMYAGATSLVLSRWLVEDKVGPIFVEEFHRQLLEGKKSVAVALRNARRKVFNDDPLKFTDWAVFSLHGDPFRRLA